jgi:predicted lipoprotein with Yx(FWY)xxD motif
MPGSGWRVPGMAAGRADGPRFAPDHGRGTSLSTEGVTTTRRTSIASLATLAALPLLAVALAGCGGGGSNASASPTPKSQSGRAATVGVANSGSGKILVNSRGRTLYLFKKDIGTKSECAGACARNWPPLRASGKATVGSGAKVSLVGTAKRPDGSRQVTYNGHLLYLFSGDSSAGQTSGQGVSAFGGLWYVLSPAGNQITASSGGGGGGGGGYGY